MIAIVDDDDSVRLATVDLLSSLNYRCEAFASAEAFLQSGKAAEAACIITDVQMPGLSGLDLQTQLRKDGNDTPVLFITSFPDQKTRQQAMADGAICFLPKPFDDDELIRFIEEALNRNRDSP